MHNIKQYCYFQKLSSIVMHVILLVQSLKIYEHILSISVNVYH